jgi:hypothetical protein
VLRKIIKQEISASIQSTIQEYVTAELRSIGDQVSGFRESMTFFNVQFEEMRVTMHEKNAVTTQSQAENDKLKTLVTDLMTRLNAVELHMRSSNIEINGVPEHRNENLVETVLQLSKVIDSPLAADDIQQVTRVAKLQKDNTRPRAVIVKLRSPRQRDIVLAAVSKFNKKNSQDKLASGHLGIGGPKVSVFVTEHLTPGYKSLHAATRKKARELSYKYVWIRNGRIYVRKDESSQSVLIKSVDSLKLIV